MSRLYAGMLTSMWVKRVKLFLLSDDDRSPHKDPGVLRSRPL